MVPIDFIVRKISGDRKLFGYQHSWLVRVGTGGQIHLPHPPFVSFFFPISSCGFSFLIVSQFKWSPVTSACV